MDSSLAELSQLCCENLTAGQLPRKLLLPGVRLFLLTSAEEQEQKSGCDDGKTQGQEVGCNYLHH